MTVVEETRQIQATNETMLAKGKAEIQVLKAMLTTVQTQLGLAEEEEDLEEPHISQNLTDRLHTLTSDDWESRHAAMERQLVNTQATLDTPSKLEGSDVVTSSSFEWRAVIALCALSLLAGIGLAGFVF